MTYNAKNVQIHNNYIFSRPIEGLTKKVSGGGIYMISGSKDIKIWENRGQGKTGDSIWFYVIGLLTDYCRLVERYEYTPYGLRTVYSPG